MEQEEFDKTVELLTPKFRKSSGFRFGSRRQKQRYKVWWRICSVAAMLALIVGIGIYTMTPVRAEKIVRQSLENFNAANSYKIQFYLDGTITDEGNVVPFVDNKKIIGTAYVVNDNGVEKERIEYDGPQQFVEVYDGQMYKRYKNGILVYTQESLTIMLLQLFQFDTAKNIEDTSITQDGDSITLSFKKGDFVMHGVFSRKTEQLTEAYVTLKGKRVLGTESIEYGIEIPDNLFE